MCLLVDIHSRRKTLSILPQVKAAKGINQLGNKGSSRFRADFPA